MNNVILVGRLTETPTKKVLDNGIAVTTVTLAIDRPFKNQNGDYDTDFIRVSLWDLIAQSACDYCLKGSLLAVKGRLVTKAQTITLGDQSKNISTLEMIGERIEFISTPRDYSKVKSEETRKDG